MHVNKPYCSPLVGWVILIKETKDPKSALIEEIKCASREQAWQTYRHIQRERGVGL